MKICKTCGEEKELTEYYKTGRTYKGKQYYKNDCKECVYQRYKENTMQWERDNPEGHRLRESKRRARKRDATVGKIVFEDILIRDGAVCHICTLHVPLDEIVLDHVIPLARGGEHSQDNLKVSHRSCNARKHTKLMDELEWGRELREECYD